MKLHLQMALTFLVWALPATTIADPNSPSVTYAANPATWGFIADGTSQPIDGVPEFIMVNTMVVAGYSSTSPEVFRGIYEFSLSGYSLTKVDATLRLQVYSANHGGGPVQVLPLQLFGYTGNGQVTLADYSSGSLLSSFTLSSVGQFDIDVSSFVTSAFINGNPFVGFNIRPNGDPNIDISSFYFGSPYEGPVSQLIMSPVVPEPHAGSIAFLGFAFLTFARALFSRNNQS